MLLRNTPLAQGSISDTRLTDNSITKQADSIESACFVIFDLRTEVGLTEDLCKCLRNIGVVDNCLGEKFSCAVAESEDGNVLVGVVIGVVNVVAVCLLRKVSAVVVSGDNEHNVATDHSVSDRICDSLVVVLNALCGLGKIVVVRVLINVSFLDHNEETAVVSGNYGKCLAGINGKINAVVLGCSVGVVNLAFLDELIDLALKLCGSITVGVVAEVSAGGCTGDLVGRNNCGLCAGGMSKLTNVLLFLLLVVYAKIAVNGLVTTREGSCGSCGVGVGFSAVKN